MNNIDYFEIYSLQDTPSYSSEITLDTTKPVCVNSTPLVEELLTTNFIKKFQPTIFYGVPTLYAALLADPTRPEKKALNLRICASADEALPAELGRQWTLG